MAPPPVVSGGLFVDHKKGEIPELKNLLRDSAVDKDPKAKRAIMERVVGYMTLGKIASFVHAGVGVQHSHMRAGTDGCPAWIKASTCRPSSAR